MRMILTAVIPFVFMAGFVQAAGAAEDTVYNRQKKAALYLQVVSVKDMMTDRFQRTVKTAAGR